MYIYYIVFAIVVVGGLSWAARGQEEEVDTFKVKDHALQAIVRNRIEHSIQKYMKETKVSRLHTLYLQAGINFSLLNHIFFCILSIVVFEVASYAIFKNEVITLAAIIYGAIFPEQILLTLKSHRTEKLEDQIISFMQMNNARYKMATTIPEAFGQCAKDLAKIQPINEILSDCCYMFSAGVSEEEVLRIFALKCNSRFADIYVNFLINSRDINSQSAKQGLLKKSEVKAIRQRDLKRMQRNKLRTNKKACYILMATVPFFAFVQATTNKDWITFMTTEGAGKTGTASIFIVMAISLFIINKKLSTFSG